MDAYDILRYITFFTMLFILVILPKHVIAASLVLNTTCSINMFYSTKPKPASVMELGEDVLHQVFRVARVFGTTSRVSNTVTSYYMLRTLPVAYTGFLHLKTFTDIRLYESIIEESLDLCLLETIWSTTLIHPVKLEIDLVRVGASVGKAPGRLRQPKRCNVLLGHVWGLQGLHPRQTRHVHRRHSMGYYTRTRHNRQGRPDTG